MAGKEAEEEASPIKRKKPEETQRGLPSLAVTAAYTH